MRTVNDVPLLPCRDPDAITRLVYALCSRDTVFNSRRVQWCHEHPGYDGHDYLWTVTKPHRDAGTLPDFSNAASYAAWVLALPADLAQGW